MKDVGLNSHSKVQIRIRKGHVAGLNLFVGRELVEKQSCKLQI